MKTSSKMVDLNNVFSFGLQRGKSFQVRGAEVGFSRACADSRTRKGHDEKGLHLAAACTIE